MRLTWYLFGSADVPDGARATLLDDLRSLAATLAAPDWLAVDERDDRVWVAAQVANADGIADRLQALGADTRGWFGRVSLDGYPFDTRELAWAVGGARRWVTHAEGADMYERLYESAALAAIAGRVVDDADRVLIVTDAERAAIDVHARLPFPKKAKKAKTPKTGAKRATDAWPFRFYGVQPTDWHEGANDGHRYEITLREPLSDPSRDRLAQAWESAVRRGPVTGSDKPWRWDGRTAVFWLGERGRTAPAAFFSAVSRLIEGLHQACPLEQVVFRGAWWEPPSPPWGTSAWDAWSVGQADPGAGLGTAGHVDAGFERARRVARLGEATVRAEEERIAQALASGELCLVPAPGPLTFDVPADAKDRFRMRFDHEIWGSASGRVLAMSGRVAPVAWLHDGEVKVLGRDASAHPSPQASPDGARLLVVVAGPARAQAEAPGVSSPHERAGHEVLVVDLAQGTQQPLWRTAPTDPYVRGMAWVSDDVVAIATRVAPRASVRPRRACCARPRPPRCRSARPVRRAGALAVRAERRGSRVARRQGAVRAVRRGRPALEARAAAPLRWPTRGRGRRDDRRGGRAREPGRALARLLGRAALALSAPPCG